MRIPLQQADNLSDSEKLQSEDKNIHSSSPWRHPDYVV